MDAKMFPFQAPLRRRKCEPHIRVEMFPCHTNVSISALRDENSGFLASAQNVSITHVSMTQGGVGTTGGSAATRRRPATGARRGGRAPPAPTRR